MKAAAQIPQAMMETTQATSPAAAGEKSRIVWLDATKGLGILLVVTGHTLGGIMDSPLGSQSGLLRELFLAIYLFHMPLFFFLSGLLVRARIARGQTGFLINIIATVVYPYFLWSVVQYSVIFAAGSLVNRPVTAFWGPILNLPRVSISQFWFLYVLFLLHLAALLCLPRIGARAFVVLAVVARLLVPVLSVPVMVHLALVHGLFYALGVAGTPKAVDNLFAWLDRRNWIAWLLPPAGILAILLGCHFVIAGEGAGFWHLLSREITARAWHLPLLPVAVIAGLAFLVITRAIRGQVAAILAFLGQRTMAIFVLHVLFIAGGRILLGRFVHPGLWGTVAICLVLGVAGPLVVFAIAKRFTNSRALGLG